jgi:hypothetical protein
MDPRYAIGHCQCTKPRINRVSGYKREKVKLVAEAHWDADAFRRKQEEEADERAYNKQLTGTKLTTAEVRGATRYRLRNGLPDPERV